MTCDKVEQNAFNRSCLTLDRTSKKDSLNNVPMMGKFDKTALIIPSAAEAN